MTYALHLKICCISSIDEALLAVEAGADALGLVSAMPSGPGTIDDEMIARIARFVAERFEGRIETFLLTCRTSVDELIAQAKASGCTTLQLCDALADDNGDLAASYAALRAALGGVKLVQVIHVEDELALDEAFHAQAHVDALLLDSGRPKAAVKELGGTGRSHDWVLSRRIVGASTVPVWLAGGLTPANIAHAIRDVGPYGIDVCSGVRTNGQLDAEKLHAFVKELREAAKVSSPPGG